MAKDPAFLFYPGDYLRDTQVLSESVQVAYDRIMCEHMRNICISEKQLKFFTKRLTEDEKEELDMVLKKVSGGYEIEWVADSVRKRKAYSESRRNNRTKKDTHKPKNISKTYDNHMENENENVNDTVILKKSKEKKIHLFTQSEFIDLELFTTTISKDEKYACFDFAYYHEAVLQWSNQGNKKKDWIATAKGFMLRDDKPRLNKDFRNTNNDESELEKRFRTS